MERNKELEELEKRLKMSFFNKSLLNQSLTHSSFAHEAGVPDNERLEFLGDAILKLAISEYIYNLFPTKPEGDLTKYRATIISDDTLAKISESINLGEALLLSENERMSGGAKRKSNLANVFEALLGAIYLDAGIGKARDFILEHLRGEVERVSKEGYISDFKSTLQEFVQKKKWDLPHYKVVMESGPRHNRIFEIDVKIKGRALGKGRGANKKEAEQKAAQQALKRLKLEEKKPITKGVVSKVKKRLWIF
ncbi:MAG: ribonuclease III [Candidatus Saganbacteria bacterium]|uniref:Ribonuclease 3 n=1 Tax=Candidatus Saganbacteria bacterium TaxID=2575572 RepID=A0A833L081_UNCSA|nr:MAG: ribonuclease III [Candidatus Saganbacteria bacterium]